MLQEKKKKGLLSYDLLSATNALSKMREELTIVKIVAISDPRKKAFSGVMGITPYLMD